MKRAVAVLLLLLLTLSTVLACGETSAEPTAETSQAGRTGEADALPEDASPYVVDAQLARYDYENYGFSILLPENPDWTYEEEGMTVNGLDAVDASLRRASVEGVSINLRMMSTGDATSGFDDETFLASMIEYYEKNGAEQIKHEERGEPAITILYYRRKDADEHKWQFYETVHNGVSVRLRYPTFGDGAEESAAVCKFMRDSIQWME